MIGTYTYGELMLYVQLYALVGWGIGVICTAVKDGKFLNRGFLNLPLSISEGITALLLLLVLPTLEQNVLMQFVLTWVIVFIVDELTRQFLKSVSKRRGLAVTEPAGGSMLLTFLLRTAEALLYLTMYLVIHPFVEVFVNWLPDLAVDITALVLTVLVVIDFFCVCYALRTGRSTKLAQKGETITRSMGTRLSDSIWKRLEKAYPGIHRSEPETEFVFAKGICFDKLAWVFLVSSFLGAMIEMVYCRITGGTWMNRSSVLYGSFSLVWGVGAVLLTVVLQRFANKSDWHVFWVGFLVGGAYEYLCSVFTEALFGTVFWDYSWMPLNIGGRTNVLYCFFWGILAVVWIKVLYPPMDKAIEKVPALPGKVLTWVLVFLMFFDAALTGMAMMRYTARQTDPTPSGFIEEFLDQRFDDDWMETRWPNMKIT